MQLKILKKKQPEKIFQAAEYYFILNIVLMRASQAYNPEALQKAITKHK